MYTTTVISVEKVEVKRLVVNAEVRYWEDATVNGKEDVDGTLVPCKNGDNWCPVIDLETGMVINWNPGTVANIHYKICDAGIYQLTDTSGKVIKEIDGYVPKILCPEENGYGDYIIMHIDATGHIRNWNVDLSDFEDKKEE